MKKSTFIFIIAAIFHSVVSTGQIKVLPADKSSEGVSETGAFYILPQTVLKIDVIIAADEQLKGPFSDYAGRFLGLDNVNKFDVTTYNIEHVEISSFIEPDPGQIYYVEMTQPASRELKSLTLKLDESGFLLAANDLERPVGDGSERDSEVLEFDISSEGNVSPDFYLPGRVTHTTDTVIRRVTVDTLMEEKYFYRTRLEDKPIEEMAVEALHKIEQIRESKYKLLTGFQETAYASGTIQFMFDKLDKLENDLLDLFRGKIYREYDRYTYYFTPETGGMKNPVTLFRFSPGSGVSEKGSGEKVEISLTANGIEQNVGNNQGTGIAYRVPGFAQAKVLYDGDVLFEDHIRINQFGVIRRLSAQRFNARFNPETGGLESVFYESSDK
jgi:hypothetical protein